MGLHESSLHIWMQSSPSLKALATSRSQRTRTPPAMLRALMKIPSNAISSELCALCTKIQFGLPRYRLGELKISTLSTHVSEGLQYDSLRGGWASRRAAAVPG